MHLSPSVTLHRNASHPTRIQTTLGSVTSGRVGLDIGLGLLALLWAVVGALVGCISLGSNPGHLGVVVSCGGFGLGSHLVTLADSKESSGLGIVS